MEIDYIPLAEIVVIDEIHDIDIGGCFELEKGTSMEDMTAVHISTEQDGHNSGRDYYMHLDTDDLIGLITKMRQFSQDAKIRRDTHTVFQRAQNRLRIVYESVPSQALIVFLMAMVRISQIYFSTNISS